MLIQCHNQIVKFNEVFRMSPQAPVMRFVIKMYISFFFRCSCLRCLNQCSRAVSGSRGTSRLSYNNFDQLLRCSGSPGPHTKVDDSHAYFPTMAGLTALHDCLNFTSPRLESSILFQWPSHPSIHSTILLLAIG